jgi:hypothetical protein
MRLRTVSISRIGFQVVSMLMMMIDVVFAVIRFPRAPFTVAAARGFRRAPASGAAG